MSANGLKHHFPGDDQDNSLLANPAANPWNPTIGAATQPGFLQDPACSPLQMEAASAAAATAATAKAAATALYLTESGETSAINVMDIHQQQIGDCFLLSSIGELALWDPSFISSMISSLSNGTENVALYQNSNGKTPGYTQTSGYKEFTQNVSNTFQANSVNQGGAELKVGGTEEIWVNVLEKAYAQANGGYAGISNGGSPVIAMEELTGHYATWGSPSAVTAASLQAHMTAKDLVVFDTIGANSTYNLVGNHAYMFDGLQTSNGTTYVKALNPWGTDEPNLIPVSKLGSAFGEVDIGHWH